VKLEVLTDATSPSFALMVGPAKTQQCRGL
jgi:hypothetical protein